MGPHDVQVGHPAPRDRFFGRRVIVGPPTGTIEAMLARRPFRRRLASPWVRRIGAGFLLGMAIASCEVQDQQSFAERASTLVCEIHSVCGEDVTDAVALEGTLEESCYTTVWDNFAECSDNCGFNARQARRCINRLERMVDDCDATRLAPCRKVYEDCDSGFDAVSTCGLWNCSVSPEGSGWGGVMALGLLVLGWRRRRA